MEMKNRSFSDIWQRIVINERNTFKTKTGKEFTYNIMNEGLITTRTNYKLSKGDFEKAYKIMPIDGPGVIRDMVRGPAYIWAVLNDKRIYE